MMKNVALTPAPARASNTSGVQTGSGPSSKVKATRAGDRWPVDITLVIALGRSSRRVGAAFAFRPAAERDVQLLELLFGDGTGGVHHLVAGGLRLREGHHLADVWLVREEHHQAIDAWGDPTVWRCAVAEGGEDGAEPPLGLLGPDTDDVEDLLLQLGAVYPHAPRSELGTVGDQVVELADGFEGGGVEQGNVFFTGQGEHVVHGLDTPLVFVP